MLALVGVFLFCWGPYASLSLAGRPTNFANLKYYYFIMGKNISLCSTNLCWYLHKVQKQIFDSWCQVSWGWAPPCRWCSLCSRCRWPRPQSSGTRSSTSAWTPRWVQKFKILWVLIDLFFVRVILFTVLYCTVIEKIESRLTRRTIFVFWQYD